MDFLRYVHFTQNNVQAFHEQFVHGDDSWKEPEKLPEFFAIFSSSQSLPSKANSLLSSADMFSAYIICMEKEELLCGRTYICKLGQREVTATILEIACTINVQTQQEQSVKKLQHNDIGRIKFSLSEKVPFASYLENSLLGSFVFCDSLSKKPLACGMILYYLYRSHSIFWHDFELNKDMLAQQKQQKPFVLWFAGLSGSGKSTLANMVGKMLYAQGKHIFQLDGDNLRHGLNKDLGFTESDRVENLRRASSVAKLMTDAGLIVLATFIAPYQKDRDFVRSLFGEQEFFEIFVDTPLEVCEKRDPKELYKKARAGKIANFTGISAPFETPQKPDLHLDGIKPVDVLCQDVLEFLVQYAKV